MKVGEFITSSLYDDKGMGRVINIKTIGGNDVFEVFFEKTKEILDLNEWNIEKVKSVESEFDERNYDNPIFFIIRLLSEKIDSLFYQKKLISASNFGIMALPHQVLTVNKVLEHQFKPRCLIADEVGLGKTIEAALIFEELKLRKIVKRILIITPSGLTTQWKDELKIKFNEDFVLMNNSTFKTLQQIYGESKVWENQNKVIASIDFLKSQPIHYELNDKEIDRREWHNEFITNQCIRSGWDMVIFDEAHNLSKNSGFETNRYQLGKSLSNIAQVLLLLTATPHQGDSEKFRNLLRLIDEQKFYSSDSLNPENVSSVTIKNNKRAAVNFKGELIFKKRIPLIIKIPKLENTIESKLYDSVTLYVSKYYNLATKKHNIGLGFFLIIYQRMVSSSSRAIFKSLSKRLNFLKQNLKNAYYSPKINIEDFHELNAQESFDELDKLYDELSSRPGNFHIKPYMEEEIDILEECVDLAKKASEGRDFKINKLLEIINKVMDEEEDYETKFIIFTEFIETQNYIKEVLETLGYDVTLFNGRMNLEEKIKSKNRFKEECQFLVTTDSGGEGINLQFCHVMINYDLPWNPMTIEQRIGRIDRIGQTKDVRVFNFVLEGTVEERVRSILDSKLELIVEEFGDDKRNDVLTALSDENNFDNIYIEAITNDNVKDKELQKIGSSIYEQAKNILKNQDFLIPFSPNKDNDKIKSYMVNNDDLIKNLVITYAKLKGVKIKEYSTKKNVYYFKDNLNGYKLKNVVFNGDLAADNEMYTYLNVDHDLVKSIISNSLSKDILLFNLNYNNYSYDASGFLFYYRFELTNNEGFVKRKLVPIFLNNDGSYNKNITNWFENIHNFNFKQEYDENTHDLNNLMNKANSISDEKMMEFKDETESELLEKLNKNKEKFEKYFRDKQKVINRIPIDNIRNKQLKDLRNLRSKEIKNNNREKNLVPKINLFTIAKVNLKKII